MDVTLTMEITDELILDIVYDVEFSSAYWASDIVVDDTAKTLTLTNTELDKQYVLTYNDIAEAVKLVITFNSAVDDAQATDLLLHIVDNAYYGAPISEQVCDAVIQQACFEGIRYQWGR